MAVSSCALLLIKWPSTQPHPFSRVRRYLQLKLPVPSSPRLTLELAQLVHAAVPSPHHGPEEHSDAYSSTGALPPLPSCPQRRAGSLTGCAVKAHKVAITNRTGPGRRAELEHTES